MVERIAAWVVDIPASSITTISLRWGHHLGHREVLLPLQDLLQWDRRMGLLLARRQ
jgi:hypothetical protein